MEGSFTAPYLSTASACALFFFSFLSFFLFFFLVFWISRFTIIPPPSACSVNGAEEEKLEEQLSIIDILMVQFVIGCFFLLVVTKHKTAEVYLLHNYNTVVPGDAPFPICPLHPTLNKIGVEGFFKRVNVILLV